MTSKRPCWRPCFTVWSGALEENADFLKAFKNSPEICNLQVLWISETVWSAGSFSLVTVTAPRAL